MIDKNGLHFFGVLIIVTFDRILYKTFAAALSMWSNCLSIYARGNVTTPQLLTQMYFGPFKQYYVSVSVLIFSRLTVFSSILNLLTAF